MEPKRQTAESAPEQLPANYGQSIEQVPGTSTPEVRIETNAERMERRSEATPVAVNAAPVLPPPLVSAPLAQATPSPIATPPVDDDAPMAANDDDLIEKEWVDKAKKIIIQTKDDPYRREQEVNKLQADYLRKRYGRELGSSQ